MQRPRFRQDSRSTQYAVSVLKPSPENSRARGLTRKIARATVTTVGLFDLLFIVLVLAAASTLAAAARLALKKQFARCRRMLLQLALVAGAYMLVVIAVSLATPPRTLALREPQCFDDWCVAIDGFERSARGPTATYTLNIRLFSRARGISQRETHVVVYLSDDRGRRYYPVDTAPAPFDVRLEPQESVNIHRSFVVPVAGTVAATVTHNGGFPIGWFIIGYDSWFRRPPVTRLTVPVARTNTAPAISKNPHRNEGSTGGQGWIRTSVQRS